MVILDANALDALIAAGLVDAQSKVNLATSGVGLATSPSHRPLKMNAVGALRDVLLQTECVAVSSSGSGRYVSEDLLDRLGIAEQVRGRLMASPKTPIAKIHADGRCNVGFLHVSELVGASGIWPSRPKAQKCWESLVINKLREL